MMARCGAGAGGAGGGRVAQHGRERLRRVCARGDHPPCARALPPGGALPCAAHLPAPLQPCSLPPAARCTVRRTAAGCGAWLMLGGRQTPGWGKRGDAECLMAAKGCSLLAWWRTAQLEPVEASDQALSCATMSLASHSVGSSTPLVQHAEAGEGTGDRCGLQNMGLGFTGLGLQRTL